MHLIVSISLPRPVQLPCYGNTVAPIVRDWE